MSHKLIKKQNGRSYAIHRNNEDQLKTIHSELKAGHADRFHDMINTNTQLVKLFDLWLVVDAVTVLYDQSKRGNGEALNALTDLINRPEFARLADEKPMIWRHFYIDYYDLQWQLTDFKIALIKHSPNNPHLRALGHCSWQWQCDDDIRFTREAKHFCLKVQKATPDELNIILNRRTKDSSLAQTKERLQAYRSIRYADKKNYWNFFKPKQHKLKVYKDQAATALEIAITHFESSETKSFTYAHSKYHNSDYKILWESLNQGRLHHQVVVNAGIDVRLTDKGKCLQFTQS
jgi:hypothetical protein